MSGYLRGTEVSKLIRKELKGLFPKQKFSVRTGGGSMSTAIRVDWSDGVALNKVKDRIRKFESIDYDQATGEILGGGNRFVFANRDVSEKNVEKVKKQIEKRHSFSPAFSEWEKQRIIQQRVWEKLNETDF